MVQPSTLLMSTAPPDLGVIYAWHVSIKRFKPEQMIRVADSFTQFLGMLSEPPAEVVAAYEQELRARLAARQAGTEQRPPADEQDGPEARRWLRRNRNPTPLAANHFATQAAALGFINELHALGARRVIVPSSSIQDGDDDGPYADSLVVFLPADPDARLAVCQRCERELDPPERINASDPNPVYLWWD
jgi:hypothetical protein